MEELKMLVDMVAHLPQMALWVALGFWAYKVIVIGSIYGVIRFVVERVHSFMTTPKHELVDIRGKLDRMTIGSPEFLIGQISRIVGKRVSIDTQYMHESSLQWLREAIDEKEARDAANNKPRG